VRTGTGTGLDDFIDMESQLFLLGIGPRFLGCPAVEDETRTRLLIQKKNEKHLTSISSAEY
jgi:hypothetical protein